MKTHKINTLLHAFTNMQKKNSWNLCGLEERTNNPFMWPLQNNGIYLIGLQPWQGVPLMIKYKEAWHFKNSHVWGNIND